MQIRKSKRFVLIAATVLGCLAVAVGFAAYQMFNGSSKVPGNLAERDKKQIVRLARWHTLTWTARNFGQGKFRDGMRGLKVLPKQQINELRENSDGTYRAYVVTFSDEATDGFNAWFRHQLVKTNDTWQIVQSY